MHLQTSASNIKRKLLKAVSSLAQPRMKRRFALGKPLIPAVVTARSPSPLPPISPAGLELVANTSSNAVLVGAAAKGLTDTVDQARALQSALSANSLSLPNFPTTSIGTHLNQVLQMINARGTLGMPRQIFLCMLGGFDTHQLQVENLAIA